MVCSLFGWQIPASIRHVDIIKNVLDTNAEIIKEGDGDYRVDVRTVFFIQVGEVFCRNVLIDAIKLELPFMIMVDLDRFLKRRDNPIFPDACCRVKIHRD